MCTKFEFIILVFTFANIFPPSVSTVHLLSIVYINTSQDTDIAKNIGENWQGDLELWHVVCTIIIKTGFKYLKPVLTI